MAIITARLDLEKQRSPYMAIITARLDLEEQRSPYMAITIALLDLEEQRSPYMAITTGTARQRPEAVTHVISLICAAREGNTERSELVTISSSV
jgi:hypothetical protein